MKLIIKKRIILVAFILATSITAFSQIRPDELGGQVNIISTGVPFLDIGPDSRSGAMGNAGVALSPDINSQHWNPSKFAFIESESGIGISYTPWLKKLVNDINLYYLTGFYRLDDLQVLSASLRYFTLGDITLTDISGNEINAIKPNEFAIDLAYSRVLSDHLSGSVAFRFIHSDLFQGQEDMEAGNSFAADLSFYYKTRVNWLNDDSEFSAGFNVSNLGTKISYTGGDRKQFLPTNMRLGVGYSTEIDDYNSFTFTVDANKLLVPTPPLLEGGTTSSDYEEMYHDMSVTKAIFRSFSDAPGGAKEELQEICYSLGAEYWYAKQFAVRAGYFHEHENKGNRKIFTAGIGLKFNMLTLDASYIIPVVAQSPLANTIRLSLSVNLDQLIK